MDERLSEALVEEGRESLAQAAWEKARAVFEQALALGESAEAYEGLAWASWWLEDGDQTFAARERAFLSYSERSDPVAAARVAIWIAIDTLTFRGEYAVATGWLQRAGRLLSRAGPCPERALLAWYRGHFALWSDVPAALELARQAQELGRSVGSVDFEMVGVGLEGLATVMRGDVEAGMRLIDEAVAAVVAGEVKDPTIAAGACCYLIVACERVRDFDRAAQWCHYLEELSRRWRFRHMFALCQTYYAGVLIERGAWDECEAVLRNATKEFQQTRPALISGAYVRLGELRRRQGRFTEAEELFARAPQDELARLATGWLALDRSDDQRALELARACLRSTRTDDATARAPVLELIAYAASEVGAVEEASRALAELNGIAQVVGTRPIRAAVAACQAKMSVAAGDVSAATAQFRDALDLFDAAGLPFQANATRLEFAVVLASMGEMAQALAEAGAAEEMLRALGASALATAAGEFMARASARPAVDDSHVPLTGRELEVLRLVADGCSNEEISLRLVLSQHTVKRHVANIRAKLDAPSRTAAASHAIREGWL